MNLGVPMQNRSVSERLVPSMEHPLHTDYSTWAILTVATRIAGSFRICFTRLNPLGGKELSTLLPLPDLVRCRAKEQPEPHSRVRKRLLSCRTVTMQLLFLVIWSLVLWLLKWGTAGVSVVV